MFVGTLEPRRTVTRVVAPRRADLRTGQQDKAASG
jgi:hypothetical protein